VVEVRVREQDRVEAGGVEGEGLAVAGFEFVVSLEQAAVDEEAQAAQFQVMSAAGDGLGGPMLCRCMAQCTVRVRARS